MRRAFFGFVSLFLLLWHRPVAAQIDPGDSVILESKTVAPLAGACASAGLKVKVYITNKDSLANIALPFLYKTISGGAYATLGRSAACARTLVQHAFTFLYPQGAGPTNRLSSRVANYNFYDSSPRDSALWAFTLSNPADDEEKMPPNLARALLGEIKFDTVTTTAIPGTFEIDSGRVLAITLQFVDLAGNGFRVNFAKAVIQVGVPFQLELVSPSNGAFVLERRPIFVWNSLRDSAAITASYTVILAGNPGFSPADTSPVLNDTSWQVPFDLQFQTNYFWKVRAITARPDTVFSETRTFQVDAPPSMPVDLYPSSGADISFNDFLVWLEGEDPDPGDNVTYQIQIDDNPDFSSPEVDQSGIDENTQPPAAAGGGKAPFGLSGNALALQLKTLTQNDNLKDDSLYYWRVRTVDNHGLGSNYTSGTRNFYLNLADSSPRVPVPIAPADDAVLTVHRPDFISFSTTDPDPADPLSSLRYNFRLDTDGEVTADFLVSFTTAPGETTFTVIDSLAENGHFFWAVRAIDSKGARSAFSAIQDFFVNAQNEPPGAFSLLSPADGSFLVSKTPILDWSDAFDADPLDTVVYWGMISADSTFATGLNFGPLSVSFHQVGSGLLSRGIDYFWKVTARDNDSATSGGNQVFRFRILQLGDANKDGMLTSADVILILNYAFLGEPPIDPPQLADMNCDGVVTPVDVVIALNVVFLGQSPPCDP